LVDIEIKVVIHQSAGRRNDLSDDRLLQPPGWST
jgi:hypothetical protein